MNQTESLEPKGSFYGRNSRWINAFVGAWILMLGPVVIRGIAPEQELPFPSWFIAAAWAFAMGLSVLLASLTDTVAAKIYTRVLGVLLLAATVCMVLVGLMKAFGYEVPGFLAVFSL